MQLILFPKIFFEVLFCFEPWTREIRQLRLDFMRINVRYQFQMFLFFILSAVCILTQGGTMISKAHNDGKDGKSKRRRII